MASHSLMLMARAARALVALLLLAWIYAIWVRSPILESRSLGEAYLEGAIGAVLLGCILAFAVQHSIDAVGVVCVAILVGHAWALQHTTDITISFGSALRDALQQLQRYHLLLVALVMGGWGAVTLVARRLVGRDRAGVSGA